MTATTFEPAVLITGASSGIGAGLAREFVRRGLRVALVARRVEQLETLAAELRQAGGRASAHKGDVTVDGDIGRVVAELAAQNIVPSEFRKQSRVIALSPFTLEQVGEIRRHHSI